MTVWCRGGEGVRGVGEAGGEHGVWGGWGRGRGRPSLHWLWLLRCQVPWCFRRALKEAAGCPGGGFCGVAWSMYCSVFVSSGAQGTQQMPPRGQTLHTHGRRRGCRASSLGRRHMPGHLSALGASCCHTCGTGWTPAAPSCRGSPVARGVHTYTERIRRVPVWPLGPGQGPGQGTSSRVFVSFGAPPGLEGRQCEGDQCQLQKEALPTRRGPPPRLQTCLLQMAQAGPWSGLRVGRGMCGFLQSACLCTCSTSPSV